MPALLTAGTALGTSDGWKQDSRVVALLQDPQGRGGTSTVISWYRRWVEARGWEVPEWYLDDTAAGWPRPGQNPTDIRSLVMPRLLPKFHVPQFLAARYQLRRAWPDVDFVHVVGAVCLQGSIAPPAVPAVVWMATTIADERSSVVPFVSPARRALYRSTLPALKKLERSVLESAAKILPMSHHTAEVLISDGVDVHKVQVVPVPIDTDYFSPTGTERRGVLFVGRARDPRKGFPRLISLATRSALVRDRGVHVVSPGERPTGWSKEVEATIRWWGAVERLPQRYGSAEVLVLPSHQEGLGIVAFEALACGTPVVAYRCGGSDHFLQESGGGIVVDDDDCFQQTVEELLLDKGRAEEMGRAGRAWVEHHMNQRRFLADTELFLP